MFKQNFTTNAHKLAGTDEYSPDLCNIYFKDDHLYVTNAHVALKQHLKHHNIIDWQHLNGKAIHCKGLLIRDGALKMKLFGSNKAILITCPAYEDQTVLLMPIMITD